MANIAISFVVIALVVTVVLAELASAILPVIIVIKLVPPEERPALASLIGAATKLRIWTAVRVAVTARRRRCARRSS
jgi:hypothetical protein